MLFLNVIGHTQPLDSLLSWAEKENPSLKALEQGYLADKEIAPQVNTLPNPEVGIGLFALPPETRLGPQRISIGASQMFPWKGTLKTKADISDTKAKMKPIQADLVSLDLAGKIRWAYYALYQLRERQHILREDIELFKALESLSMVKVQSGKASMSDVLRVQLKIRELERRIELLKTAEQAPTSMLNTAIGRVPDVDIRIVDKPDTMLTISYEELIDQLRVDHPSIELLDVQEEVANENIKLNKLKGKPTFGVGLDYIAVGRRSDADPAYNGRDILIPKLKVKIPIFRKQYEARDQEQKLRINALEEKKNAVVLRLSDRARQAFQTYESAHIQFVLYHEQAQTTRSIIKILQTDYSSAGKSFDELLKYHVNLVEYDLKILDAYVLKAQAVAKIKSLYLGL